MPSTGSFDLAMARARIVVLLYPRTLSSAKTREDTMRGYTMNRDDYLNRLRRIEGQVRGLQRMISDDEYCIDVLTQIASVSKALQGVGLGPARRAPPALRRRRGRRPTGPRATPRSTRRSQASSASSGPEHHTSDVVCAP